MRSAVSSVFVAILMAISASAHDNVLSHRVIRQRRSERALDLVIIRIENLEINLRREQTRNGKLQARLERLELDGGKCDCPKATAVQLDNVSETRLSNIETGLSLDKVSRYRLEHVIETLKISQQDNQKEMETFKTRQQDNQEMETLKTSQHDNQKEMKELNEKFVALQTTCTNLSNIVHLCQKKCEDDTKTHEQSKNISGKHDGGHRQVCPREFTKLETGCYYFQTHESRRLTHESAQMECRRRNASLVSVETAKERETIQQYLQSIYNRIKSKISSGFLTSGKRITGQWKWVNGKQQKSTIASDVLDHWGPGQPNGQDCLSFWPSYGFDWADVFCTTYPRQFVCEI